MMRQSVGLSSRFVLEKIVRDVSSAPNPACLARILRAGCSCPCRPSLSSRRPALPRRSLAQPRLLRKLLASSAER